MLPSSRLENSTVNKLLDGLKQLKSQLVSRSKSGTASFASISDALRKLLASIVKALDTSDVKRLLAGNMLGRLAAFDSLHAITDVASGLAQNASGWYKSLLPSSSSSSADSGKSSTLT